MLNKTSSTTFTHLPLLSHRSKIDFMSLAWQWAMRWHDSDSRMNVWMRRTHLLWTRSRLLKLSWMTELRLRQRSCLLRMKSMKLWEPSTPTYWKLWMKSVMKKSSHGRIVRIWSNELLRSWDISLKTLVVVVTPACWWKTMSIVYCKMRRDFWEMRLTSFSKHGRINGTHGLLRSPIWIKRSRLWEKVWTQLRIITKKLLRPVIVKSMCCVNIINYFKRSKSIIKSWLTIKSRLTNTYESYALVTYHSKNRKVVRS